MLCIQCCSAKGSEYLSIDCGCQAGLCFWISESLRLPGTLLGLGVLGSTLQNAAGSWSWLVRWLLPSREDCYLRGNRPFRVCLHLHLMHHPKNQEVSLEGWGAGFLVTKTHAPRHMSKPSWGTDCNKNWQFLLFSANHSRRAFHLEISQHFTKANYSPTYPFDTTIITI